MKILVIGDSLTRGSIGISYVKILQLRLKGANIVNAGVNGDTLNQITYRLLRALRTKPDYDYIVFQAGYNDLLLPALASKGFLFQFGYRQQLKKGITPFSNLIDFERFYINAVGEIANCCSSKIILTTIGPINEWQDDPLNRQRMKYNDAIRRIAGYYKCLLADTGAASDRALEATAPDTYFLNNFWNFVLFDPIACIFPGAADILSRKRNLQLTMDGIHLNTRGATIFSHAIKELLYA